MRSAHAALHDLLLNRLCVDGGLATTLEKYGADLSQGKLWSARLLRDDPGLIKRVHCDFLRAGANIICSATYQASLKGFEDELGISRADAEELIRGGVRLAKEAVAEHCATTGDADQLALVGGSLGPYGALLADGSEYSGRYQLGKEELVQIHEERLRLICSANPDLVCWETIPSYIEAEAILFLMNQSEFSQVPYWISFQCRDSEHLADGTSIDHLVVLIRENEGLNSVAVGSNCIDPAIVPELLQNFKKALGPSDCKLVCYPNSGEIWHEKTNDWKDPPGGAKSSTSWASMLTSSPAFILGGCCRTTPDHISALSALLRQESTSKQPDRPTPSPAVQR